MKVNKYILIFNTNKTTNNFISYLIMDVDNETHPKDIYDKACQNAIKFIKDCDNLTLEKNQIHFTTISLVDSFIKDKEENI